MYGRCEGRRRWCEKEESEARRAGWRSKREKTEEDGWGDGRECLTSSAVQCSYWRERERWSLCAAQWQLPPGLEWSVLVVVVGSPYCTNKVAGSSADERPETQREVEAEARQKQKKLMHKQPALSY